MAAYCWRAGSVLGFSSQRVGTFERLAKGPREVSTLNGLVVRGLADEGFVEIYKQPPPPPRRAPVKWARLTDEGRATWASIEPHLRK